MVDTKQEVQLLQQDTKVNLLTIDYTNLSGGSTIRLTNSTRNPLTTVQFNSNLYSSRRFEARGFSIKAGGPSARPTLTIDNTDRFWWSLVRNFKQLRRASVKYLVVYAQHLDSGSDPDTSQSLEEYDLEIFQMERIDRKEVVFRLNAPTDSEEAMFGRQMLRHTCNRSYRVPASTADTFIDVNSNPELITCPYTDVGSGNYFKKDGSATTDWQEDCCGQRRSDCVLRFGANATLPAQLFSTIGNPTV